MFKRLVGFPSLPLTTSPTSRLPEVPSPFSSFLSPIIHLESLYLFYRLSSPLFINPLTSLPLFP